MLSIRWVIVAALPLCLVSGCSVFGHQRLAYGECVEKRHVLCENTSGNTRVIVKAVDGRRFMERIDAMCPTIGSSDSGVMTVSTVLANKSHHRLQLEARTLFRKENCGREEPPTAWRRMWIEPNSSSNYESQALDQGSRIVIVEVRNGDKR